MKANKIIIIALILFSIISFGCGKKKTQTNTNDEINNKELPVIIDTASKRNLEEFVQVIGTLEGKTDIAFLSETAGKIVSLNKKLGDWVEKGETIGSIDNSDYENSLKQAEASLISAEAGKESAEMQMSSSEQLFKNKSISAVEYAGAKSNYKNALANYEGAKARVDQAKKAFNNSRFIAPVAGQIVDLPIQIGQTISMGTKICGLVDTRQLMIKTGVGESVIRQIKRDQLVDISYDGTAKSYKGKISGIGFKPLAGTANYPIEIHLIENSGLLPGMVVKGKIRSHIYTGVIFVPMNCVVQEYDKNYVFTVDEKSVAHRVEVELGTKVNEYVIVLKGINSGDRYVTEGFENLEEGAVVTVRN